ncbi:MAG TPA: tetraacyldisaccharide 4'-kinase [Edaphocola sp.]|nr:tetraacyldisaccharide 4'-kinase [Edaphocola sp.]
MKKIASALAVLLKPLLYPLSLLYGLIAWIRNRVYDKGIYNAIQFSVPVVSVGNLSAGGTGKTPHIEYLIRLLQYQFKVATMSRGYRRKTSGFILADHTATAETIGDEPMQFFQNFPEAYVTVCADRMSGIPELLHLRPDTEVILLDDAYQHRSVQPGLNILIMDFSKPFYKDYILPFGRLREGRSGYKRADIIIVSKCPPDGLAEGKQQDIIDRIKPLPEQQVFFTTIAYRGFYDFFSGRPVIPPPKGYFVLVSGIARPEPLLDHLRAQAEYVHLLRYPDHHYFTASDLDEIQDTIKGWKVEGKAIVISEKDAVRLALHKEIITKWEVNIYVIPIQVRFLNKAGLFSQTVLDYIQKEQEENYTN